VATARQSIPTAAVFRRFSVTLSANNIPIPQPIAAWEIVSSASAGSERTMVLELSLDIKQYYSVEGLAAKLYRFRRSLSLVEEKTWAIFE
jgi:hypothetical protein